MRTRSFSTLALGVARRAVACVFVGCSASTGGDEAKSREDVARVGQRKTRRGRGLGVALFVAAAGLVAARDAEASDHVDGLKTSIDNAADVTDLYTFTSPANPNKLVMIMSVHPAAWSGSKFSNAVDYLFRIRPIDDPTTLAPSTDARREQRVVCNFSSAPVPFVGTQRATCRFELGSTNETVTFDTRNGQYRAGGSGERNGCRVFAGVRSDSWFLDLARTLKFNNGLPVDQSPGINGLHGQNVLSIVVEVDKSKMPGALLAITAQTVRK